MQINKKKLSIQILSLIGIALTIELAVIYYVANYQKYALSSFCSINSFVDCDGVARTIAAQFLGIPLAYWGLFLYLTILFLTFVDRLKNIKFFGFLEVFKNPKDYIAALGSFAFLISMVLAGISTFKLNKICLLCLITYIIDLIIALVATDGMFKNIVLAFKITWNDFVDGAKKYTKTFVTLVVVSTVFLTYSGTTYNFVPHIKRIKHFQHYGTMKKNPYRVKGNTLGPKDADVVIELYSDYVCPLCYVHNIMLHKAVREFKNVKVIHHNYPFDKECNRYINVNMHPNACFMARGAIAARNQNNYWEMSSLLYEKQPKKEKEILKLAEQLNFDTEKFLADFNSEDTQAELFKEIENANNMGIDSTPTMYVNGEQKIGIMTYDEMKDLLIKHGAKH
ncbi:thioredoxin domain-containing protein [bacterium]|nr:thioredoxin domain-containing protein [bacterium]